MTEFEAIQKLHELSDRDTENAHYEADDILCKFLRSNGHDKIADAFNEQRETIGFWYA